MRLRNYYWITCLILCMLFRGEVMAAAVPAYSGKMNNAVGGVIAQKVGKWGFPANDPRYAATLGAVGASVTTLATGIAVGGISTVGWPALLVSAGISALVGGALSLGQDSLYKWLFNSGGTITTQGSPVGVSTNYGAMTIGGNYFAVTFNGITYQGGGSYGPASSYVSAKYGSWAWGFNSSTSSADFFYVDNPAGNQGGTHWEVFPVTKFTNATHACSQGQVYNGTSCIGAPGYVAPSGDLTNATVSAVIAAMPDAELAKSVDNTYLAAAANAAWKSMSASGSNALPWSSSDPITPAEVAQWKTANPSSVPTVGDAIAPVAAPSATAAPISEPGATPATGPAATPGQGTQVDLGPNPNIGAPTLEATPTAASILAPIFNLMPDLKSFAVPSHATACPQPSFVALSHTYTLSSHCDLIENNRSLVEAAMLLVWTLASVFIVLRA